MHMAVKQVITSTKMMSQGLRSFLKDYQMIA
jgi:hypothetical protein